MRAEYESKPRQLLMYHNLRLPGRLLMLKARQETYCATNSTNYTNYVDYFIPQIMLNSSRIASPNRLTASSRASSSAAANVIRK